MPFYSHRRECGSLWKLVEAGVEAWPRDSALKIDHWSILKEGLNEKAYKSAKICDFRENFVKIWKIQKIKLVSTFFMKLQKNVETCLNLVDFVIFGDFLKGVPHEKSWKFEKNHFWSWKWEKMAENLWNWTQSAKEADILIEFELRSEKK